MQPTFKETVLETFKQIQDRSKRRAIGLTELEYKEYNKFILKDFVWPE